MAQPAPERSQSLKGIFASATNLTISALYGNDASVANQTDQDNDQSKQQVSQHNQHKQFDVQTPLQH
jgi:hypothetical protein